VAAHLDQRLEAGILAGYGPGSAAFARSGPGIVNRGPVVEAASGPAWRGSKRGQDPGRRPEPIPESLRHRPHPAGRRSAANPLRRRNCFGPLLARAECPLAGAGRRHAQFTPPKPLALYLFSQSLLGPGGTLLRRHELGRGRFNAWLMAGGGAGQLPSRRGRQAAMATYHEQKPARNLLRTIAACFSDAPSGSEFWPFRYSAHGDRSA